MPEEKTVEDFLDEAAAARAEQAGVVPAKAEDEGKSATPEAGENTADHAEDQDEGEAPESEEADAEETSEDQEAKGEDSEEEDEKPKPRPPSKAQKRIRRLVRERDEVQARLEQREAELRVLLQQHEARAAEKPNGQTQRQEDPQPRQEDYPEDFTKFIAETAAWAGRQEARKALESEREAIKQAQSQNRQQQAEAQRVDGAQTLFEKGVEDFEDFEEVAGYKDLPVTDAMTDAIMDMEDGHKVLYHLGSNPEEAQRISKLRPVSQVRELTKLEASLSGPAKKVAPKKATSATEPIKPVKAGGAPNKKDPDTMSMKEYMEQHRARQRRGEITV